jgi:hypothetical protein
MIWNFVNEIIIAKTMNIVLICSKKQWRILACTPLQQGEYSASQKICKQWIGRLDHREKCPTKALNGYRKTVTWFLEETQGVQKCLFGLNYISCSSFRRRLKSFQMFIFVDWNIFFGVNLPKLRWIKVFIGLIRQYGIRLPLASTIA